MVRQQSAEKKGLRATPHFQLKRGCIATSIWLFACCLQLLGAPAPKKEAAFRPMVYNAGDSGKHPQRGSLLPQCFFVAAA
jgi:hypothetical protein